MLDEKDKAYDMTDLKDSILDEPSTSAESSSAAYEKSSASSGLLKEKDKAYDMTDL